MSADAGTIVYGTWQAPQAHRTNLPLIHLAGPNVTAASTRIWVIGRLENSEGGESHGFVSGGE